MIHVSQGHEKSISLEVFLKALFCFDSQQVSKFVLHCFKNSLIATLRTCIFNYELTDNQLIINDKILKIKLLGIDSSKSTETIYSLKSAINDCDTSDILLTLPSSKDQFRDNNQIYNGHTEYFRHLYKDTDISMLFINSSMNMLLLSDHIPLNSVGSFLNSNLIYSKTANTINKIRHIIDFKNIYFSGINPHSGENGLLGNEDGHITKSIQKLKNDFPHINFSGPIPADTMYFENFSKEDLLIYAYHDQGLVLFKSLYGLSGINTTIGLPFIRVSPDHGTAFNLYGKNVANYSGMIFLLNEIAKW